MILLAQYIALSLMKNKKTFQQKGLVS